MSKMVFVIDNICRLCMSPEGVMYPIFYEDGSGGPTDNLTTKIMTFTSIKLHAGDGLPALICHHCVHQVNRSYDFKIQCENSDSTLRQYVNSLQTNNVQVQTTTQDAAVMTSEHPPDEGVVVKRESEFLCGSSSESTSSFAPECSPASGSSAVGDGPLYVLQELVPVRADKPLVPPSDTTYILQELGPYSVKQEGNAADGNNWRPCEEQPGPPPQPPPPFQCPICEKTFPAGKCLETHVRTHMGSGNECPVCHKRFAGNNSLRVHVGIHARVKPHQCQVCKKSFAQKGQLKVHTRLHTGERPYQCHICQEAFFQMVSLSNHIKRYHSGETPFKCTLCGKSFTSKSVLTGHLNVHTRRYECPVCKELFTRKKYLTAHVKLHSGRDHTVAPAVVS